MSCVLDDLIAFGSVLGPMPGYVPPRQVEQMRRDDFDVAADERKGGALIPAMPPRSTGRASRLRTLERLVDHVRDSQDFSFGTMETYTRRWAAENPVGAWERANPLRTGANALAPSAARTAIEGGEARRNSQRMLTGVR